MARIRRDGRAQFRQGPCSIGGLVMPAGKHALLLPSFERIEPAERLVCLGGSILVAGGDLERGNRALCEPLIPEGAAARQVVACGTLCDECCRHQRHGQDDNA